MTQYPNYHKWLELLAMRDAGTLLVLVLAFIAVAWLINVRSLWPRFLPAFRTIALISFYSTLALALVTAVISNQL